ncbi:MAG: pyridoxamine 5'-phosphate oxidase family protein [Gemmatimonadetes bacterium]|nr:pyridoxamine 5'-phosphate oxidase family protein [Gemmatimonadota bacterium]
MIAARQLVLALAAPLVLAAQGAPTKADIVAAARDVMTRARYATLATNGPGAQPQARIVDPMLPDKDMIVWIGTNSLTRKLAEIRANNHVTLLYFDAKGLEYVTLLGTADIVTDKTEAAKHWKAEWEPFYKKGAAGADFALIRVRANRLEVVSPSHKLVNDPPNWRPAGVNLP